MRPCNRHIRTTLRLTRVMIKLAERGDIDREDVGCGILYGIMRDSAYRLQKLAEQEKQKHVEKGWWKDEGT